MEELEQETRRDDELLLVKEALLSGNWDDVPNEFKTTTIRNDLAMYEDLILRGDRIVIPKGLRKKVVELAHTSHQGSTAMKAQLRSKVWFPMIDKMVDLSIRDCKPCRMTSLPDKPNPIVRRIPTEPWQDLAVDFKEGLPGEMSLLVVVCYTSRFIQIDPMKPATTQKVIGSMLKMFSSFGIPRSITADNGPQFRANEFQSFCTSYGIHLNLSTPYWPIQNGAVERQMRNIGKSFKISKIQNTDWLTDLNEYLLMYHTTPQETNGISPAHMMFSREIRNRIPSIQNPPALKWESVRDHDMANKEKHKVRADKDRNASSHLLKEGDTVLMKNLKTGTLDPTFRGEEFEVTGVEKGAVQIKSSDSGKSYIRNSTHLKKLGGISNNHEEEVVKDGADHGNERPKRLRKLPDKFGDYNMD